MNPKRTIVIFMATFAAIWITDLLIHQLAMQADYVASMHLWRSSDTMKHFLKWLVVGQCMAAAGLTVIWINRCAANTVTIKSAARFGFFVGLIGTAYAPVFYAVMPLPGMICVKWAVFGILQSIVVTLVLYFTTKKLAQMG
ncbi:MAG: hypothetical protein IAE77_10635 [Prosthecobacter sp.]|jgi:hypothetical protein|uniref:hypothetical protein n=1 Tax=Prosthecobacter sp. TaxID=1965333 RepID=UPI0019F1AD96|nr:hypothetical protein [Prosthecobacter sp.]MBE2283901.1 hypothetical protein [Prosthecobacter sp.]